MAIYKGTRQNNARRGEPAGSISFEIDNASSAPEKIAQKTCKIRRIIILSFYITTSKSATSKKTDGMGNGQSKKCPQDGV